MNRFLSRFLIVSLSLAFLATAQSMAVARGANPAVEHITLCTGHGPVAVYLDADGAPTEPPHVCPDCALFFAALPGSTPHSSQVTILVAQRFSMRPTAVVTRSVGVRPPARGPPAFV